MFKTAVDNQPARTANDMKARASSANACTDLFFKIGASRGDEIISPFIAAYVENSDYALRIAQWARDIRGGAGERQLFRDILLALSNDYPVTSLKLMDKVPEIGRWDDLLLEYKNKRCQDYAFGMIRSALGMGNGLCAKWMPRKGYKAKQLREHMGLTPKQYRKLLVRLTDVVETTMCNGNWDSIPFGNVPSLASARYKTAFYRNAEVAYTKYVDGLATGESKVNACAVYPYDVLKTLKYSGWGNVSVTKTDKDFVKAQWAALPNFMGDANILPMVDVSASMNCAASGSTTCLDVAVSLGLYCAEKNKGQFKDLFLTFSESPQLLHLKGDIVQKFEQMVTSRWGMNTNLHAAFNQILDTAINGNVGQSEMPETVIIFSDMQFDSCCQFDDSAYEMISRKFSAAAYKTPKIVFWNLNSYDNAPVKFDQQGVALVSGFSPAVMKSIIGGEDFTPEAIMLKTIMIDRYAL